MKEPLRKAPLTSLLTNKEIYARESFQSAQNSPPAGQRPHLSHTISTLQALLLEYTELFPQMSHSRLGIGQPIPETTQQNKIQLAMSTPEHCRQAGCSGTASDLPYFTFFWVQLTTLRFTNVQSLLSLISQNTVILRLP